MIGLALVSPSGHCVYPFGNVNKQIANGDGDSIAGFYRSISAQFQMADDN